jgi:acetylornithine deacetylase
MTVSTDDAVLLEWMDARAADVLDFARRLIATPSINPGGDEREAAACVEAELRSLGIEDVRRVGPSDERPSVIARVPGSAPGPVLMLCGHLDTKPPGDMAAWRTDPFDPVLADGELIGLGSGDMKAAVAAMVYAAAALVENPGHAGELLLVFTADEEAGSAQGAKWLAENGVLAADVAVLGEPCGVVREWEAIDVVSRGAALFKVKVFGTQMHSSISDRLPAVNASLKMARLMDRMDRRLKDQLTFTPHPLVERGPTVNVGVAVSGGVFYGVYPGYAEFACDIRTLPGMTEEQMVADLERFLAEAMADDPELRAELAFEIFVEATEIATDEPIVAALQEAAALVLDEPPVLDAFPGATDAAHIQLIAGIPTVAAFGPGFLPRAHSPNESLPADSVADAARIYALASARYLGPPA